MVVNDNERRLRIISDRMTETFWELKGDAYEVSIKYADVKDVIQEVTLIASGVELAEEDDE